MWVRARTYGCRHGEPTEWLLAKAIVYRPPGSCWLASRFCNRVYLIDSRWWQWIKARLPSANGCYVLLETPVVTAFSDIVEPTISIQRNWHKWEPLTCKPSSIQESSRLYVRKALQIVLHRTRNTHLGIFKVPGCNIWIQFGSASLRMLHINPYLANFMEILRTKWENPLQLKTCTKGELHSEIKSIYTRRWVGVLRWCTAKYIDAFGPCDRVLFYRTRTDPPYLDIRMLCNIYPGDIVMVWFAVIVDNIYKLGSVNETTENSNDGNSTKLFPLRGVRQFGPVRWYRT